MLKLDVPPPSLMVRLFGLWSWNVPLLASVVVVLYSLWTSLDVVRDVGLLAAFVFPGIIIVLYVLTAWALIGARQWFTGQV